MPSKFHGQRGMTIIETTVILSVLFILAGAMSPIVSESVSTARGVRAKNDAMMIAMGLVNLMKDMGGEALSAPAAASGLSLRASGLHLPDVLATGGDAPEVDDEDEGADQPGVLSLFSQAGQGQARGAGAGADAESEAARGQRRGQRRKWREGTTGALDDHLMANRRGYRYRRPGENAGWNGPYITAPIKSDPWGKRYLINSEFLDGGSTAADADGRPRRAVFVVSSGANAIIETPYDQPMTDAQAFGDDIVIRIQ